MKHDVAGDPITGVKWTRRTTRKISQELLAAGIHVSSQTVARILKDLDYSLRVNHKNVSKGSGSDRDEQFKYISEQRTSFGNRDLPIVSIDSKKKELTASRLAALRAEYKAIDDAVGELADLIDEAEALRRGAHAELTNPIRFNGLYSSTYGEELEFRRDGDRVRGSYNVDNGEVVFDVVDEFTLDGYWIEDLSRQECETSKEGRDYWGRLIIRFDEQYRSYSGHWDYCERDPETRSWSGELIRR
jgi:hypothetical protein